MQNTYRLRQMLHGSVAFSVCLSSLLALAAARAESPVFSASTFAIRPSWAFLSLVTSKFSWTSRSSTATAALTDRASTPETSWKPSFRVGVVAAGLTAPDGLAIHPGTHAIYVSEEDAGRVCVIEAGRPRAAIDANTIIYRDAQHKTRYAALRNPEGMAFSAEGELYVVEDFPGGQLIRFTQDARGSWTGELVPVPGGWTGFAWEDVDVSARGEILLAGSDLEKGMQAEDVFLFGGAVLYRDAEGQWWVPYQRTFASFSCARFSKDARRALYACELTGEVGWIDLEQRRALVGHLEDGVKQVEGLAVLPNGMFMLSGEGGEVICANPSNGKAISTKVNLGHLESIAWDAERGRLLVVDDRDGRILSLTPDVLPDANMDLLDYAVYHPAYSPQNVPSTCPGYLASVLARGGLDFNATQPPAPTFREFAARVPFIAADAVLTRMENEPEYDDPLDRLQFIVFYPNAVVMDPEKGPTVPLSAFTAHARSGEIYKTHLRKKATVAGDFTEGGLLFTGETMHAVPQPGPVSVSALGVTTVQFLGLGEAPDFSIVLNPRVPEHSYALVVREDGRREHYWVTFPQNDSDHWVIAYNKQLPDQWTLLSGRPKTDIAKEDEAHRHEDAS